LLIILLKGTYRISQARLTFKEVIQYR